MKLFRSGFWAKAVTCLTILVELALLIAFSYLFSAGILESEYAAIFVLVLLLLNLMAIVIAVNAGGETDYKVSWLAFLGAIPVFGLLFYVLFAHKFTSPSQKAYMKRYDEALLKRETEPSTLKALDALNPSGGRIARYIERSSHGALYRNSAVTYFPLGDEAFPAMLEELRKARHYIFLEYFIVHPGIFWDEILKILKEKAKAGLDIRLMYDDVGSLATIPSGYRQELRKMGIKCEVFMPIRPFLDIRMNNRDHRKILVIDGHTAFSGGINLADEYINAVPRFGHWKDNAVMVKGKAVEGFTLLFLANWAATFEPKSKIDYDYYRPETFIDEAGGFPSSEGFLSPYGDVPYDDWSTGAGVYSAIITGSRRYLYVSTPYLILDSRLRDELCQAALSGVDVRILTPHIPDKKTVFQLTRANYGPLLKAGVRVFEYTPGFVHQKMFVSDDSLATCGTINLDYRSLYLHLENGLFIAESPVIMKMRDDFLESLSRSEEWTYETWKKRRRGKRAFWAILRVFAPLL